MKENWKDRVASKVSYQLLRLQTRFAEIMEKKTANVSFRQIKILLVLFCLIWGGLSGLFITQAILFQKRHTISIEPIHLPQHSTKTGEPFAPSKDSTNK